MTIGKLQASKQRLSNFTTQEPQGVSLIARSEVGFQFLNGKERVMSFRLSLLVVVFLAIIDQARAGDYLVVSSRATQADSGWQKVVETLVKKHAAETLIFEKSVVESLPALRDRMPRFTCFVATPSEVTRDFVADVHRLTRKFDDDPFTDTRWGILTGFDSANALAIAAESKPLTVRKTAAGTDVALDKCEEGIWYCELQQRRMVRKVAGGAAQQELGPPDTTAALAATLSDYKADLFVTSGHATERDWQIGFRYRNGSFQSREGKLFGVDTQRNRLEIRSDSPKVYLAVGNCLMGHIDGPDAMALAFMNSAGVRQMAGYTVLTWYGYSGWGCLDFFVEQPGRYTLNEAFLANQHSLVHRLQTYFPELMTETPAPGQVVRRNLPLSEAAKSEKLTSMDGIGLLHDRDVLAFYGDPAWDARMAPAPCSWDQSLTEKNGVYTLTISPKLGPTTFVPVNRNGSQRGGRPIVAYLPHRIRNAKVVTGADLQPVITDDFVLVPNPRVCDREKYEVSFTAEPIR